MKIKTSITLSGPTLEAVDLLANDGTSRSAVIEGILRSFFRKRAAAAERMRELKKLNAVADRLNRQVADTMEYQSAWPE